MKIWNKETRNELGKFYRDRDWAVEVDEDFLTDHPRAANFTTTSPPKGKCDWDEGSESWTVDPTLTDEEVKEKRAGRYETELPVADQLDIIFKQFDALQQAGIDMLPKTKAMIRARKQIEDDLPLSKG